MIRISAEEPEAELQAQGMACSISVEDNGRGFDASVAQKIFELFERASDERADSGFGIGLTVCHRIVSRLGGEIRADGRPGEGATFTVSLPEPRVDDCPSEPDAVGA